MQFQGHHSYFRKDFQMLLAVKVSGNIASTPCTRSNIATTKQKKKNEEKHTHTHAKQLITKTIIEPRHEKTGFLHMRKQRRKSASR